MMHEAVIAAFDKLVDRLTELELKCDYLMELSLNRALTTPSLTPLPNIFHPPFQLTIHAPDPSKLYLCPKSSVACIFVVDCPLPDRSKFDRGDCFASSDPTIEYYHRQIMEAAPATGMGGAGLVGWSTPPGFVSLFMWTDEETGSLTAIEFAHACVRLFNFCGLKTPTRGHFFSSSGPNARLILAYEQSVDLPREQAKRVAPKEGASRHFVHVSGYLRFVRGPECHKFLGV